MSKRATAIVIALAVIAAGCGDGGSSSVSSSTTSAPPPETTTTTAEPVAGGEIGLTSSSLGEILTDGDGMTLYIFTVDTGPVSSCYDQCAANWPPVPAGLAPGPDVATSDLGSTTRDDGFEQLTINGRPVYLFVNDANPGDTNGQGINEVWFVIGADGEPIGMPDAGAAITTTEGELGTYLVDGEGYTLYMFKNDSPGTSTCYEQCEANWPPVAADAEISPDLDQSLFRPITRDDGTEQLAIGDWALYYFANDANPGDTNGQGAGGVWFVIGPDGIPIEG